jgi:alpha-tubulin suppressor-like RCC1 family protein
LIGARLAALAALALLATSCLGPGDFRCTEHAQCTIGGRDGFCEANGRCSVADPTCETSRRRYVHHAGGDADACVPEACGANKILTVSAGGGHACLVRTDGSLWCWGRNDRGQLGDGTRTPRALPVRVAGIDDVIAVAAGDVHTCAATAAGAVFCWGADDTGQLGDRGGTERGLPQRVAGVMVPIPTALDDPGDPRQVLAAGKDFSCAVDAGAGLLCWGDDSVGQLGDAGAAAGAPLSPTPVPGVTEVEAISASWQHACALTTGGQVACWGANNQGQIGDGSTASPRAPTAPDPASLPPTLRVTSVVTGSDHTCALSSAGLMCWGGNAEGQVDPQAPPGAIPTPQQIGAATDPISVAAGAQHTCIVSAGGGQNIKCWGADGSEQLGDGTPIGNATAAVAGGAFSCALATDGALYCWGDNHFGQLAIGGNTARTTPAQVPGLAHVTALAAGGAHTCATADDVSGARALFCWGANDSGQLGNGSSIDAAVATRISSLEPTGIAAGARHTCAFPADKQLRCWGWGASGQLGQPAGFDMVVTVPTATDLSPPEGGDGVFAVVAGASHTCVGATISASVLCFGLNVDGQLGNGRPFDDPGGPGPVPAPLGSIPSLLAKPVALAAGDAHTCALDEDGGIWCWGRGDQGQLGDESMEHTSPVQIALEGDATKAEAITAGAAHTCVIADGRVLCWGRNAEGQLGAPLPAPLFMPRVVSALPQARALVAGGRHTCAIDDHAAASCWGANESGQLGNGTTDSSNIPVPVAGLTNVDAIVAGGAHTCARRSDGTVWCWGANTAGQLGDGVTLTSPRPLLARIACE